MQDEDKVRKELRQSEERYHSLVKNIPDVIWTTDHEGTTVFISQNVEQVYGFTPEEIYQSGAEIWLGRIHPEDVNNVYQAYKLLFESGNLFDVEYRIKGKDGKWIWLHDRAITTYEKNGVLYSDGMFSDITMRKQAEIALIRDRSQLDELVKERTKQLQQEIARRKQAEEELREKELRYRNIIALSGGVVYEHGLAEEGIYHFMDEGIKRLTGYSPDEMNPKLLGNLTEESFEYSGNSIPIGDEIILRDNEKKVTKYRSDFRIHAADGRTAWLADFSVDIRNSDGEILRSIGILQDITERKQAEEMLVESEARYCSLFEGAIDSIFIMEGYRFVECNSTTLKMYGCENKEDIINHTPWEFSPQSQPDGRSSKEKAIDFIDGALAGKAQRFYWKHIQKNGTPFDAEISLNCLEVGGKKLVQAIARDITEQKKAEEQLQILSSVVEQSQHSIGIVDEKGIIEYVNPKLLALYEVSSEDVVGKHWLSFVSMHSTLQEKSQEIRDTLLGKSSVWSGEVTDKSKSGELVWRLVNISPIRNADGIVTHTVYMSDDITERKRMEEELRNSEERMRILFEFAPDAYYLHDLEGNFVNVNRGTEEVTGYKRSDLIGKNILKAQLLSKKQISEASALLARSMLGQPTGPDEFILNRQDGSKVTVEIRAFPVKIQDQILVLGIARDITERRKAEAELRESNLRLEETLNELKQTQRQIIQQERLRALGQLASGIAHDFNNALMPIMGYSELLLSVPGILEDKEKTRDYLKLMNTSAEDAKNIVRRLREFYRPREGNEAFTVVDISQLVEEAIRLTQPRWKDQAQSNGVNINVEAKLQQVPLINGNKAELREALTNLILNAVDAMPAGGTLGLYTCMVDKYIILGVSDTGMGMTEEIKQHCFEPFFSTKEEGGTGLGLSMVYGIIQRHDGTIKIESELGNGTTFIIHLPQTNERNEELSQNMDTSLRPLNVLVVDDEPLVIDVVTKYLMADGHRYEVATNGREGLIRFREGKFDLVITDRAMPDMGGIQLAAFIKQLAPNTPIMMLTGFGDLMETPENIDGVLSKPVTLTKFREALASIDTFNDLAQT